MPCKLVTSYIQSLSISYLCFVGGIIEGPGGETLPSKPAAAPSIAITLFLFLAPFSKHSVSKEEGMIKISWIPKIYDIKV